MDLYFVKEDKSSPLPYDKLRQCTADYRNQCPEKTPYICTRGLVQGSCTSDPNVWQKSRMCREFCDVRNAPNVRIVRPPQLYFGLRKPQVEPGFTGYMPAGDKSKKVPCPSPMTRPLIVPYPPTYDQTFRATTQKMCRGDMPYQCIAGPAFGGCSADPQFWENSPICYSYCDSREKDGLEDYFGDSGSADPPYEYAQ